MSAIVAIPTSQFRKLAQFGNLSQFRNYPPIRAQLEPITEKVEEIEGVYFYHPKPGKLIPLTCELDEYNLDYTIR